MSIQLYGLDLSAGMLHQARLRHPGLLLIQGRAEQVPFPDHIFNLVYCVNASHHFEQPWSFIFEASRLLQSGAHWRSLGWNRIAARMQNFHLPARAAVPRNL